ncbi:hypothetical protein MMPV_002066 [Pyropia vietnamensis]
MDLAFAACPFVGGVTPLRAPAARRTLAAAAARPAVAPAVRMRHGTDANAGAASLNAAPAATPAASPATSAALSAVTDGGDARVTLVVAPAIAPRQRPHETHSHQHMYTEVPASGRSADMMAPRREGFWAALPYMAAAAVVGFGGWVAQKKVRARHAQLVADFGATLSAYGSSDRGAADIVADYKRKVGPGVDRKGLYRSGLASLITDIPAGVSLIRRVTTLQRLLGIKDVAAASEVNALGKDKFSDQPSLLGKLIFVSERVLADGGSAGSLRLRTMLPYSEEVVDTLQRDMAARILASEVSAAADRGEGVPGKAAALLRMSPVEAQALYDETLARRAAAATAAAEEAAAAAEANEAANAVMAAAEAEATSVASVAEEEKASAVVDKDTHVYECGSCGYTLYPAKGREFRFFPDSFKCPMCGAPKDQFTDISA